jgi:hypothetical protein
MSDHRREWFLEVSLEEENAALALAVVEEQNAGLAPRSGGRAGAVQPRGIENGQCECETQRVAIAELLSQDCEPPTRCWSNDTSEHGAPQGRAAVIDAFDYREEVPAAQHERTQGCAA